MITVEIVYTEFENWIMLGVGLWGGSKGNSHMGKGHRVGESLFTLDMSGLFFYFKVRELSGKSVMCQGKVKFYKNVREFYISAWWS